MNILVVYFSRSGTTAGAAQAAATHLRKRGHGITTVPLEPRCELPYPLWLALSFVPRSRFPLARHPPDPGAYSACLLALPKWTFSCPPVNTYLARRRDRLPPTAVLVTCGGWDQDRYLAELEGRLRGWGVTVRGGLALRRRELARVAVPWALRCFLEQAFPADSEHPEQTGSRT